MEILNLKKALEQIMQLKSKYYFRRASERVALMDSVGRELSEDIIADSMSPEFDIAAMDGFAVRSADNYPLKITGKIYAGDGIAKIDHGECVTIATGAILPHGADSVLKIEDSDIKKDLLYGKTLNKWENVFRKGSEYNTAIISASPRSCVVEGYVITDRDIKEGELVNVYLFC